MSTIGTKSPRPRLRTCACHWAQKAPPARSASRPSGWNAPTRDRSWDGPDRLRPRPEAPRRSKKLKTAVMCTFAALSHVVRSLLLALDLVRRVQLQRSGFEVHA